MTVSNWIGQTIGGRYKIQDLLGQGGMSAVYKAYDPNLRRVVAVKIIHPHLSTDAQFVHRFEEEAAAVAQLRHPNLIQVYDFNHDDEVYYIIFEYVPGETVQARLKRLKETNRNMDVDETVKITRQVADGLQNAHSKGLIHRDIKPANIIINVTGDPILMDFGIAKIMGGTQHTATGAVLGTARYMSPEQIQGSVIDPRTDIYSLGVTLFEMLGGRPPFEANSAMTLMMMHMTDPVPDLNAIRAEVPSSLVAVVNKSLAKKPADRYQTAEQMAAALSNWNRAGTAFAGATMLETASAKEPEADKTYVEPLPAGVAAAAAYAGGASPAAAQATTPPAAAPAPRSASAAPPAKSGGSRSMMYIAGAVVLLLLIAIGAWALFFRDNGETDLTGGGEEIPAVVIEAPDTPDAAATEQAIAAAGVAEEETRAAEEGAQTAEAAALAPTDTVEPTEEPTPEPAVESGPTFTPEQPAESVANVDQLEGEVTMITADGAEVPLTQDTAITEGSQFITGQDGQLALTLEDAGVIQLLEESHISLDSLGFDPANELQQTAITMFAGDLLLRVPPGGSEQAVFSDTGVLLATLANGSSTSDNGKQAALGKRVQQSGDEAAMSVSYGELRVFISCYSGECTTAGGNSLNEGWEKVLTQDGSFISSFPLTNQSPRYQQWQAECEDCLPQAPPPPTATSPPPPATNTPIATAVGTVTATATAAGTPTPTKEAETTPTSTAEAPPPTTVGEATAEPTAELTPTPAQPSYSSQITNIALENGRYIVSFTTSGFTPGPTLHVHFYFDTVSEANAGIPGSGPWKLYRGGSPFTEYAESDKYGQPSAMCIRVANEDHSIIPGTGNCFPLP